MDYKGIHKDIESGVLDKATPILLCSEEQLLLDFYEKLLLESYGADPIDVSVFYGNDTDDGLLDEKIINALDTLPMFSPARVVIIRNHPKLVNWKGKGLSDFLVKIPDTSRLIFFSNTAGADKKSLAFYKDIEKTGKVYDISRLTETGLKQFALKRFKQAGTEISLDLLDAFIYATGYMEKDSGVDLFMVENDAYKLAYYVAAEGRKSILLPDLEECLQGFLRTNDFAMLDAISLGKKAEAVRLLENTLTRDENTLFHLLSLYIGHFEIMLGYKELSATGLSSSQITTTIGQSSEWRVKKLGDFAQRFDKNKLEWILSRLYEMDRDVKSGDIKARDALTVLIAEM